jgi:hypothetical protein
MSNWQIRLPIGDPDQLLVDAIRELPRVLDGDEQEMTFDLLATAKMAGFQTVGDLHASIDGFDGATRLLLLNALRRRAGLPSTKAVDDRKRLEAVNHAARVRAGQDSAWQICHADGCSEIPISPVTGIPTTTEAKRWFCAQHRALAEPGDLDPRPSGLRIAPGGALVEIDPTEEARDAATAESLRNRSEARLADGRAGAAEIADAERADREQVLRDTAPGVFPR